MRRKFWRAGAAALGLLLGLGLVEGALRLFRVAPAGRVSTVTESEYARVPGIFTPNVHLVDRRNPALPHQVRINTLGYRGVDFPRAKPPGEVRVLLVGDSFTYGDFVDDDATLPAQLERELRARGVKARAINAGLSATTIVGQRAMVDRALPLQPDLVLLTFSENDVDDMAGPLWPRLAATRRLKSRFPVGAVYPVLRRTALWNFALQVRARRQAGQRQRLLTTEAAPGEPAGTEPARRARYAVALRELHEALAAKDLPLVFLAFPSYPSVVVAEPPELLQWAERTAVEAGIATIALAPPLRAASHAPETLYLVPHDKHPSPQGYGVAAAYVADRLLATVFSTPAPSSPSDPALHTAAPAR